MKKSLVLPTIIAVASLQPCILFAEEPSTIEEVQVLGVRERLYNAGMLKDVIQKTEVLSAINIERLNASNLTEAIAEAPGVRVNNECSMCGVKRVMLNGLRGEHTTILVDGIPTHTMMSGFYGLDAAPSAGIERIEIARGAGASLIAPEAIGGTLNLITKTARENSAEIDIAGGETGYRKASLVATGITNQDSTRVTLIANYDNRDQWDGDNNGVSENPQLENRSISVRLSQDFGSNNNIIVRAAHISSEIFGGPMGTDIGAARRDFQRDPDHESSPLFVDGDVRNRFIGRGWETTEWIDTTRTELAVSWLREVNANFNFTLTASNTEHEQDSFYEGFIYIGDNEMTYLDARFNWSLNSDHLLTFGADSRDETLRSQSNSTSAAYISDSFDYDTLGLYLQDTWTASENLEISAALRFDQVEANFVDPQKPGVEIDESIVSPRLDARYTHNDQWTSRVSVGRGYRAPLSFFESDHGILDGELGFAIDITDLERSLSSNYALSFEGEQLTVTGSIAYTNVEKLAVLDETDAGIPLLTQMSNDARVIVADIALSYALNQQANVSLTAENIDYDSDFKQAFGIVPIEQRVTLSVDWYVNGWELYGALTWVGSRDLSEYGTPESPTFDEAGTLAMSKNASSYTTVDFRIAKEVTEYLHLYAGASNLFDYNQAEDMETPLFYEDGGYDVGNIYGPLRGREIYAGVKFMF